MHGPTRAPIMEGFFKVLFGSRPIKGMEVGVWYGKGSTKIWLENCVANSEFWLVDTWRPFLQSRRSVNEDVDIILQVWINFRPMLFLVLFNSKTN